MCRAEEIKYRAQKLQAFLLKARACAADEGHRRLLARNATEFAACLRLREQVQFLCMMSSEGARCYSACLFLLQILHHPCVTHICVLSWIQGSLNSCKQAFLLLKRLALTHAESTVHARACMCSLSALDSQREMMGMSSGVLCCRSMRAAAITCPSTRSGECA